MTFPAFYCIIEPSVNGGAPQMGPRRTVRVWRSIRMRQMNGETPGDGRSANLWAFGFCLLAAAAVLMICSTNSFLYPLNPWGDVNCFITVARGWMNGLAPYRDLVEQKGPLLYFIHVIGLLLSPRNYHGFFVLEVVFLACSAWLGWRILRLYAPKACVGWVAPVLALICASRSFEYGDLAEEWCMPLILASVYAALNRWRTGREISLKGYALHGFLAGCVLWIKFNQLGAHFVFMAVLAVEAVAADRSPIRALKMCGAFLLGMLAASLPWLIWFAAAGALRDLIGRYFIGNISGYGIYKDPLILRIAKGVGSNAMTSTPLFALLACGAAAVLAAPRKRMGRMEKLWLVLAAAAMTALVYGGGVHFRYYLQGLAPLAFFGALPAAWAGVWLRKRMGRFGARRIASLVACAVLLAAGTGMAWRGYRHKGSIGRPFDQTDQGQIAAVIRQSEDRTLLNVGDLDRGFYFAADVLPVNRFFCTLNYLKKEAAIDQGAVLSEGRVRFAVTWKGTLENCADKVNRAAGTEIMDIGGYRPVMQQGPYYLYERIDPEVSAE